MADERAVMSSRWWFTPQFNLSLFRNHQEQVFPLRSSLRPRLHSRVLSSTPLHLQPVVHTPLGSVIVVDVSVFPLGCHLEGGGWVTPARYTQAGLEHSWCGGRRQWCFLNDHNSYVLREAKWVLTGPCHDRALLGLPPALRLASDLRL